MSFCPNCGAPNDEGSAFCANCGTKLEAPQQNQYAAPQQGEYHAPQQGEYQQYQETPQQSFVVDKGYEPSDIEANKLFAILAYLGPLVFVPVFAAKNSKFARFHANNGLVIFIAWILSNILLVIPIVRHFVWIISIIVAIVDIIGLIQAIKGEAKPIPVISDIQIIK